MWVASSCVGRDGVGASGVGRQAAGHPPNSGGGGGTGISSASSIAASSSSSSSSSCGSGGTSAIGVAFGSSGGRVARGSGWKTLLAGWGNVCGVPVVWCRSRCVPGARSAGVGLRCARLPVAVRCLRHLVEVDVAGRRREGRSRAWSAWRRCDLDLDATRVGSQVSQGILMQLRDGAACVGVVSDVCDKRPSAGHNSVTGVRVEALADVAVENVRDEVCLRAAGAVGQWPVGEERNQDVLVVRPHNGVLYVGTVRPLERRQDFLRS